MRRTNRAIGVATASAAFALVVAAALAWQTAALAHVPILELPGRHDVRGTAAAPFPNAQPIAAPTKSLAIYGYMAPDEQLDAYTFSVTAETTLTLDMLVAVRPDLADFRPTLTLLSSAADRPAVMPDPGTQPRKSFYEPFSVSDFYQGGSASVTLLPGRRYFLVVEPGAGARHDGAYTIGVSGGEQFTAAETVSTVLSLPTIWLGSWGGGPVRPGAMAALSALGAVLVAVVALVALRHRRVRAAKH
jgi:hypothetical protein